MFVNYLLYYTNYCIVYELCAIAERDAPQSFRCLTIRVIPHSTKPGKS